MAIPLNPGHAADGFQLQILGDNSADTVNILDFGNQEVLVADASGKVITFVNGIRSIRFEGGVGADNVNYKLQNPLTSSESIYFDLGTGGQDRATLDFSAGVTNSNLVVCVTGSPYDDHLTVNLGTVTNSHVTVFLNGEAGDDSLTFGAGTDVDATSSIVASLNGGTGNDRVFAAFSGLVFGSVSIGVFGNDGNDTVNLNEEIEEGSTGAAYGYASGGTGTDDITLYFDDYSYDKVSSQLKSWRATIVDPSLATTTIHDTSNNVTVTTSP
ncbi:MAG TPA: hypothetical protein VHD36_22025 [Pirellulales bacterium]|nr:hypothetical protein [Pirellulales bacterium]